MELASFARIYRDVDAPIHLRDVWFIGPEEVNSAAAEFDNFQNADAGLYQLHRNVAWLSQAVIEFTDLLGLHFPRSGRWQHTNYLYFEALSSLREVVVTLLNSSPRASLAILRSSFEMFLLHCWWQQRLFLEKSFEPFYDRLEGRIQFPAFSDVLRNNIRNFVMPDDEATFDKTYDLYRKLCSYVHAPLLYESVTTVSQGNRRNVSQEVFFHCLRMIQATLRYVLEHLIFHKPQCLFPVEITKKFGFSPPVGMYFDRFNFIPLRAALGDELIEKYRLRARNAQIYKDVMSFYHSHPDLSDVEIQDTWDEECQKNFGESAPVDVEGRFLVVKTHMRVLSMAFSYQETETAHALHVK